MPERLVDVYAVGDWVIISFKGSDRWLPGRVVMLDHPGVWVQTPDGRRWFVTNGRRIRKVEVPPPDVKSSG